MEREVAFNNHKCQLRVWITMKTRWRVRRPGRPSAFVRWLERAMGCSIIQKMENWAGSVWRDTVRRGRAPMTLLEFPGQPMVHNLAK